MPDSIVEALLQTKDWSRLSSLQWDLLIRQARRSNLLSRLALRLRKSGIEPDIPTPVQHHLFSGEVVAQRQEIAIRAEVGHIRTALAHARVPLVLLKGAAYVLAGLPAAQGRVFSDVDIIVPKPLIGETEAALMLHGWHCGHQSDYDQTYYRRWMHEIPPMTHMQRGTVIDVHHAILPDTARIKTNAAKLLEAAVPVAEGVYVLAPADMLLHSATHLFHEGELGNGLRDLFDLDSLLRHFGAQAGFWDVLAPRAVELGLSRPLYYALRYTTRMLGTPVPDQVMQAAEAGRPSRLLLFLMDFCYLRALRPNHASCSDVWTPFARKMLYVRSHWIRMPFHLLIVHLARKAFFKEKAETPEAATKTKAEG